MIGLPPSNPVFSHIYNHPEKCAVPGTFAFADDAAVVRHSFR